jgi:hypothetical protein
MFNLLIKKHKRTNTELFIDADYTNLHKLISENL